MERGRERDRLREREREWERRRVRRESEGGLLLFSFFFSSFSCTASSDLSNKFPVKCIPTT